MGLVKLTFNGSLNIAQHDASFNRYLIGGQNGVIKGLGEEIKASVGSDGIVFKDGYVIGHGRRVYIEKETRVNVDADGNKKGRISVFIDAVNETAELVKHEIPITSAPTELPAISINSDTYECPLCYYETTASKIKITSGIKDFVETHTDILERRLKQIKEELLANQNSNQNSNQNNNQGGNQPSPIGLRTDKLTPKNMGATTQVNLGGNQSKYKNGILSFSVGKSFVSIPMAALGSASFAIHTFDNTVVSGSIEKLGPMIMIGHRDAKYAPKKVYISY